jgi:hypothetical protein
VSTTGTASPDALDASTTTYAGECVHQSTPFLTLARGYPTQTLLS